LGNNRRKLAGSEKGHPEPNGVNCVPGSIGMLGPEEHPEKEHIFGKKEGLWSLTPTLDLIGGRSDGRGYIHTTNICLIFYKDAFV